MSKILIPIMELWEKQTGNKLAIEADEGEIYEILKRVGGDGVEAKCISNNCASPTLHFKIDRFLFASDLKNPENIGKMREIGGKMAEFGWNLPRTFGGNNAENRDKQAEDSRNSGGILEESTRRIIGKGKVNLPQFSDGFAPEIARICEKIENVADQIFKATAKDSTIKATKEDYEKAKTLALKGDFFELNKMLQKLEARRANQKNALALNTEKADQEARRRMLKSLLKKAIIAAVVIIILLIVYFSNSSSTAPPEQSQQPDTLRPSPALMQFSAQGIETLLNDYQARHDTSLSPWRKNKIIKILTASPVNPETILQKIDSLAKYK